jgi:hypothetical protein
MGTSPDRPLFAGHGIDIVGRGRSLVLIYDAGGHQVAYREVVISADEALLAQRGEATAYQLILDLEAAGRGSPAAAGDA